MKEYVFSTKSSFHYLMISLAVFTAFSALFTLKKDKKYLDSDNLLTKSEMNEPDYLYDLHLIMHSKELEKVKTERYAISSLYL